MLLWLWHRPAAVASIQPLVREPPYAMGVALKKKIIIKKKEEEKKKKGGKIFNKNRWFLSFQDDFLTIVLKKKNYRSCWVFLKDGSRFAFWLDVKAV